MTKGQFALLTAALGLVTMGGAGYYAYASSTPHSSSSNGAAANGQPTAANSGGAASVPSSGSSPTPTTGDGSGATGGQGGGRACQNGEVQVTEKAGQGAAGTVSVVLVFQNVSGSTCTLRGYPGASLIDQNGKDLLDATRVLPDGLAKAPLVVLAPGVQAAALLLWSDVPTGSGSGCAAQNPANLLVTPPNTTQSTQLQVAAGTEVCSAFRIRPVLSGVTPG
jgi:hypothetical protein